jgi:hypothetical protein
MHTCPAKDLDSETPMSGPEHVDKEDRERTVNRPAVGRANGGVGIPELIQPASMFVSRNSVRYPDNDAPVYGAATP